MFGVVAHDHVGVVGVAVRLDARRSRCATRRMPAPPKIVSAPSGRRPGVVQAVEAARAADQVVLAEAAEDRVVAAVALDPVAPVAVDRRPSPRPTGGSRRTSIVMRPRSSIAEPSPWIQSSPSWPKMTSSFGAAGDDVAAERARRLGGRVVEEGDGRAPRWPRSGRRCGARRDERRASGVEDRVAREDAEARAEPVAGAQEVRVVARDPVVPGATVDVVAGVGAAGDVVAADQVVVALAARDPVGALAAEDDVVAGVAADQVGAAVRGRAGVDRRPAERVRERASCRQQRQLASRSVVARRRAP